MSYDSTQLFRDSNDGKGPEYLTRLPSNEMAQSTHIPTSRWVTPLELRERIERWKGSDWVDEHWGEVIDLMAIALLHAGGDLDYSNGRASGLFAIDSSVWNLKPFPAHGDQRLDIQLWQQLGGMGVNLQTDRWIQLMAHLRFPLGSPNYDWVSPFTVLEENTRNGMGILAPLTLDWQSPTISEQVSLLGAQTMFLNSHEKAPWEWPCQVALWLTLFRSTMMACAWWWPRETRQVLLAAAGMSDTRNKATISAVSAGFATRGEANLAAWFGQAIPRMRQSMLANSEAWLPPTYLRAYCDAQRLRVGYTTGRTQTDTAEQTIRDGLGALANAAKAGGMGLLGAAMAGIVLYAAIRAMGDNK